MKQDLDCGGAVTIVEDTAAMTGIFIRGTTAVQNNFIAYGFNEVME